MRDPASKNVGSIPKDDIQSCPLAYVHKHIPKPTTKPHKKQTNKQTKKSLNICKQGHISKK